MNSELSFNDVMLRLKTATKANSYNSLAEMMGLSSSAFANFKKRDSIPYDRVFSLASSLNVSADWILTGEGDIYRTAKNTAFFGKELDKQEQLAFELFLALSPERRKEILAIIEKEKRALDLEKRVIQLEQELMCA